MWGISEKRSENDSKILAWMIRKDGGIIIGNDNGTQKGTGVKEDSKGKWWVQFWIYQHISVHKMFRGKHLIGIENVGQMIRRVIILCVGEDEKQIHSYKLLVGI